MILKDDVTAAIRRAFQLGQTYWQQADSESYKENKKADATRDRYNALCIETAEIAARADTRIAELETAMKRQAAAVRMPDMYEALALARDCVLDCLNHEESAARPNLIRAENYRTILAQVDAALEKARGQ